MNREQEMLLHELRAVLVTDRPEIDSLPIEAVLTQANILAQHHRRHGDHDFAAYLHKLTTEFWNTNTTKEGASQ